LHDEELRLYDDELWLFELNEELWLFDDELRLYEEEL